MYTGFKHLHVTVVILFILLLLYKTVLLLTNKNEKLDQFRAKTKIADMILGSLLIITGGYLLVNGPQAEPYHYVKIIAALLSIPMGIISFKRKIKPMAVFTLLLFIYLYGVAETKSLTFQKKKISLEEIKDTTTSAPSSNIIDQNNAAALENGKLLYNAACASCHGVDGKLGLTGAADLSSSSLSHVEKVTVIKEGKGTMASFKDQLSEQDIETIATYVDAMKK